jgi:uncharacterized protein (TIGR03067 family)
LVKGASYPFVEIVMRTHLLPAIALGSFLACSDLSAAADDTKNDADKLQGNWGCVSGKKDGKPIAEGTVQKLRLVLTKDKYATYRGDELLFESVYKLDTAKSPRRIDIIGTEGDNKGKAAQGIYLLEGETLKLCYTMPGKDRPNEFESKPGSGASFTIWKRAKP